ncbi:hypothetical protein PINS_up011285 [Pythium insidiosum]|nr:hypothetical protein PINS_up011285 [Pythium insidiosum]
MDYAEWLRPLYDGVLALNTAQLVALATDSTGSRCVVEPIWESADDARQWVRHALFLKFVGHFGALALDRLGAFSVMKCFEKLALADKAIVAQELAAVEPKLQGSHFAQLVMNTVHLLEFMRNREKWQALFEKKDKIADLFKDVVEEKGDKDEEQTKKAKKDKKMAKKRSAQEALETAETHKTEKKKHKKPTAVAPVVVGDSQGADIDVIMGALRGSLASSKGAKKSKKSKKHQHDD